MLNTTDITKHSYTHNTVQEVDPVHAMKAYERSEVWLHSFFTFTQDAPDALPMGTVSIDEEAR
jgi:hypothetical protein